MSSISSKGLSM